MQSGSITVSPDVLKLHWSSCAICLFDIFLVSFLYHSSSLSGCTSHWRVVKLKLFTPASESMQVLWNQLPTPFGVESAIHRPPVESVGYKPVHNSSRLSIWAASSRTKRDKASERPASPDVEAALIDDPLESSKDVRLSTLIVAIWSHEGTWRIIPLTFFTRFPAVANFVAITRIALSRWNNIIHTI